MQLNITSCELWGGNVDKCPRYFTFVLEGTILGHVTHQYQKTFHYVERQIWQPNRSVGKVICR
jgi:hypothetical protein